MEVIPSTRNFRFLHIILYSCKGNQKNLFGNLARNFSVIRHYSISVIVPEFYLRISERMQTFSKIANVPRQGGEMIFAEYV